MTRPRRPATHRTAARRAFGSGTRPVLAGVLIGALVFAGCGGDDTADVVLVAADAIGDGPFTSPVAETPARSLADFSAGAPDTKVPDDAIAITIRRGDEPGLYAGRQDAESCDRALLAQRLTGAPAISAAWAAAVGADAGQVADVIDASTGVETTVDLRVTLHRWDDGTVVADQAVLEAGTAVLVRADGTPLARCLSGAPLAAALPVSGTVRFTGAPWPGFAPDRLDTVLAADAGVGLLDLVDPETGQPVTRTVG